MYRISANIVCKNEKYWIKESISSIVNLVDEIIFVDDGSTDGSLEISKELANEHSHIKIYEKKYHKQKTLRDLKNYAMDKSKNDLVLRWDADFIAYDDIDKLLEYSINNIDKFDAYVLKAPNLHGDIYHYLKGKEHFGPEVVLYKKNKMRFKQTERYNDYPVFDEKTKYCYPLNTTLKKSYFFIHMNMLKSLEKIAYRKRMTEYQMTSNRDETYWQWLADKKDEKIVKQRVLDNVKNIIYDLTEFNFNKWGNHPKLLSQSESVNLFSIEKVKNGYKINVPN